MEDDPVVELAFKLRIGSQWRSSEQSFFMSYSSFLGCMYIDIMV